MRCLTSQKARKPILVIRHLAILLLLSYNSRNLYLQSVSFTIGLQFPHFVMFFSTYIHFIFSLTFLDFFQSFEHLAFHHFSYFSCYSNFPNHSMFIGPFYKFLSFISHQLKLYIPSLVSFFSPRCLRILDSVCLFPFKSTDTLFQFRPFSDFFIALFEGYIYISFSVCSISAHFFTRFSCSFS